MDLILTVSLDHLVFHHRAGLLFHGKVNVLALAARTVIAVNRGWNLANYFTFEIKKNKEKQSKDLTEYCSRNASCTEMVDYLHDKHPFDCL